MIGTQHPQDCLSTQTSTSVDSPGGTLNMTASRKEANRERERESLIQINSNFILFQTDLI